MQPAFGPFKRARISVRAFFCAFKKQPALYKPNKQIKRPS
ncbi:hypothetical protein HMPREF9098_0356 [Kingella denitrificans ATCC 33394]|uniref:Uncharacterized protein n=1 Tax=Kingella denitrificans ATCC 33394 TaxID=888741 RepID=F0EWX6_9NEIS|nr:hypothetical protein HMPREF9098_0356 [Kingella denitrificans ATCC 33394]